MNTTDREKDLVERLRSADRITLSEINGAGSNDVYVLDKEQRDFIIERLRSPSGDVKEAWWKFFHEENLVEGSSRGNLIDDMKAAFEAGFAASGLLHTDTRVRDALQNLTDVVSQIVVGHVGDSRSKEAHLKLVVRAKDMDALKERWLKAREALTSTPQAKEIPDRFKHFAPDGGKPKLPEGFKGQLEIKTSYERAVEAEANDTATAADASNKIGSWLSAALDDPHVCAEMKADIHAWFNAGQPLPAADAVAMRERLSDIHGDLSELLAFSPNAGQEEKINSIKEKILDAFRALPAPAAGIEREKK
jgi:hypothetical protein